MCVITISRQYGSLGSITAQHVADRLNYTIVWRELINQAAMRAGAPDVALAEIDELNLLGVAPTVESLQAYIQAIHVVVMELAKKGNVVIVGRGSQVILREFHDVVRVLMIAPLALRAERIATRLSISLRAARAQVEASDRHRQHFLRRFYGVQWDDPALYDLVINTQHLTADDAVDLICRAAQQPVVPTPTGQPV
ncbi:MAG TPA: cytidylate kinase-like family protein [Anaerolineaceae bacterium]|nr:cytidylate kinase-like family protein [Anaerolineaceae bacterium]